MQGVKYFARFPANIIVGFIAAALTPVLVVGLAVLVATRVTALPSDAAFRADGVAVSQADLKHRLDVLKALYGIAPPQDPRQLDEFRRQSAQAVVLSMVLDRAAREEGIVVEDKDARDSLTQLIGQRFPDGLAGFAKLLGTVGASEQDVVDELKRQLATTRLFDKVAAGRTGQVTPAQARQFYDQNPAEFVQPESRHLRNIVVATQDDANQVMGQAKAGADFAALAKQFSLDQSTRDSGGDLGSVARDQLDDAFAGPAFAAPVGGVFGPAKTEHGWNIGQVLEVRPATTVPFEQIAEQLRAGLTQEKALAAWRTWVGRRLADAHVEYADDYRPRNPDTVTAPLAPSPSPASDTAPSADSETPR